MRILVAEDEKDLNNVIVKKLTSQGYSVDACFDGNEAVDFLEMTQYDVAILDIMMPVKDGFDVLKHIRSKNIATPVIFLTARDSVEDRVTGLDMGAADYIVKPFSFDELLARIRVATRKASGNLNNIYTVADLSLDSNSHTVTRNGKNISLSAKEFSLLEYLLRNKGKVLSREQIENNLWNFDYEGGTNVIDVYISYLRKKIDEGHDVRLIHTVRGRGYMLNDKQNNN